MKKIRFIILVVFSVGMVFLMVSCMEEDIFVKPEAKVELSSESVGVFEEVTISNNGQGQKVTIFTGKEGEIYGEPGARGIAVNPEDAFITTTYIMAGNYNVTIVATGFDQGGSNIELAVDSTRLLVTDTVKTINKVVYNDLYTMIMIADFNYVLNYRLEIQPNSDRNLIIPIHDHRVNGLLYLMQSNRKDVTDASKYAFKPLVVGNSLSLSYEIENEPLYNTGNTIVDHSEVEDKSSFRPVKYTAVAADGSKLDYYGVPVVIPYFSSLSLNSGGAEYEGVFWVSRLDYEDIEFVVNVPVGADSTSLVPTYELNDTENVVVTVINDGKPESDFSGDGQVVYELTYTRPRAGGDAYLGDIVYTTELIVKAVFDLE